MSAPQQIVKPKSKRLLRMAQITGFFGAYTVFHDFIKPAPSKQAHIKRFRDFEQRNIVVIGAGVVGLTTAYYLSKN